MKYEFTLTLKPLLYQFDCRQQFKLTREVILRELVSYEATIVAELTNEHNVHYHCLIELRDISHKDQMLNRFRKHSKMFGRKTCSQVMFEDSYKQYIRKSLEQTRSLIGDPIVRDTFKVFQTIF